MAWDERYQKELLHRLQGRLARLEILNAENSLWKLEAEIEHIIAANSAMVIDGRTRPHLRLAATVLACYRALSPGLLDPQEALELIENVFAGIGRSMLRFYTWTLLTFSRDPFTAITQAGKRRVLRQYGKEWEFRIEETDQCFRMTATKCFYADFFQIAREPQLTRVFCRWDQNWIEPIDPVRHKICFDRPTTMGYGGSECPFIFKRVDSSG
ncbi:MAG: L-2-amino-thiazoline-4-carboxylic acid hydrolase [Anaerolineales bacterium]|nr:L-2-amino-thiazoline-4-carboxylic acid hydrolase [Anaerolineales bacterium]